MKPTKNWPLLLSVSAVLLMSGCGTQSRNMPVAIDPPAIPALPSQARQSATPSACSPSCLESLTTWRANTLQRLTEPAPQD